VRRYSFFITYAPNNQTFRLELEFIDYTRVKSELAQVLATVLLSACERAARILPIASSWLMASGLTTCFESLIFLGQGRTLALGVAWHLVKKRERHENCRR
jgi:hypothetical protein